MVHLRLLAPSLLALAAAGAAEPAPEALIVTATRLGIDPFIQPYALHPFGREAIDEDNRRTLIDAVDRTPGVYVQRTAGNQASPYIRGLTGQQTLLMFDGVRLNHALFRSGPNQYAAMLPDEAVERVDAILGTGTTVLGSDGLTGALDFRLAEAGRGQDGIVSPWAKGRYGSAEGGGGAAGFDGRLGEWAYSVEGGYASFTDLAGGSRAGDRLFFGAADQDTIPHVGYDQYSLGARVAYLGHAGHRVELAAGHVAQTAAPRPDGYPENSGSSRAISRSYDPQTFDYVHLRHAAEALGPWDRAQTTLWWHRHRELQEREDWRNVAQTQYRRRVYDDAVATLGADLQLTHLFARHELTYGATAYQDRIASAYEEYRQTGPAGIIPAAPPVHQPGNWSGQSSVPDGSRFTGLAGFAQDHWRFAEAWSLLGGLRFDHVSWSLPITATRPGYADIGDGTVESDAQAVTGNLRVSWQPAEPWLTWGGISQGFRTPTASDLAGTQDRASGSGGAGLGPQTEGNPDLDPELSLTLEWGLRYQHAVDSVSLALFRTAVEDLIQTTYIDVDGDGSIDGGVANGGVDRAQRLNASDAVLYGGELACDLGLPVPLPEGWRLSLFQTTSYVQGTVEVPQIDGSMQEQPISRANTLFGKAGARLAHTGHWFALAQVRWADRYDDPAPGDANDVRMTVAGDATGRMPGWAVVDLKAGISDPRGAWRFDLGVENLGDITYRQLGSGADGAGLNLIAGGQYRF